MSTQSSTPAATGRSRDVNRYWWAQTTTAFGSVFTAIAMPVVAVVYLGATPGQVGLISAASILPTLVLGLPAGALADRVAAPRRLLIALDTFSAVAVALVALSVANHVASVATLIALSIVQGCVSILSSVVYFIHLRQLVDTAAIGPVRARLQAGQYGAGLIGRLLAGPAIVAFGGATALGIDAVSYLLSAAALLSMSPVRPIPLAPPHERENLLRSMAAGTRFFLGHAFHRALLVFIIAPVVAGAAVTALTAPFLLREAHIPTEAYGAIFALSGLMGLAGSSLAGRVVRPGRDPRQITLVAFTASLAAGLLLPLADGPLALAAAFAGLGVGLPVLFGSIANVALTPVLVEDAPDNRLGSTMATLQVFVAAAGIAGALAGGALGDRIGVRSAIWLVNIVALAAVAVSLPLASAAARRLHRKSADASVPVAAMAASTEAH
ncbi:MFS transporter [Catellatospora tritici]|uniref:MFS transporter n=1 Tax=Catellatospora tritici TaxID=2851566 RepID=UPI001C2D05A6|nr:MFS transporter [Catellatospora tritici]MBV1850650.1 MFS transporter [Catellatospora tritici]